jgi:hypothetical protein|tara:strand:+ start:286 stop:642 length:357 start_codon:yes stop_codon:yes gene_type:complete
LGALVVGYYLKTDPGIVMENIGGRPFGWALGIASFLVPIVFPRWISPLACMATMLLGVTLAGTIFLLVTGPGNLWPIAIAVVVSFAVFPVGAGALLSLMLRLAVRATRGSARVDGQAR